MKYVTFSLVVLLLGAVAVQAQHADKRPIVRPYIGIGSMLNAPSADELGYMDADGGNLDQYLKHKKTSPCLGLQVLVPWKDRIRLGGEIGFRRLFSSEFNTGTSDISFINEDYDTETELEVTLLGLIEYQPSPSGLFLMGGVGLHVVRWEYESQYESTYSSADKYYSGTETNFGLMGTVGYRIDLTPNLSAPVMVRVDYLLRYNDLFPVSLTVGLDFRV